MARTLTKKQKGFAKDYLETGNATKAVLNNYDVKNEETAGVMGSENLGKPKIQEYLQSKASRAAEIVFEIAEFGESDQVKLSASKDILDRAGHKAVEKSIHINVNEELTDKQKEYVQRLHSLKGGHTGS